MIRMMRDPHRTVATLLLALVVSGCNLGAPSGPGPNAWIDFPADGMSFSYGTIVVQSHSTGPAAIQRVDLYVNGASSRSDLNPDSSAGLVPMSQAWVPDGPGTYILQVRAMDSAGNEGRSLPVRVIIAGSEPESVGAEAPTPPPTLVPTSVRPGAPAACVEPSATLVLNGNCRAGPSAEAGVLDVISNGTTVRIVGRNEDASWWLVQADGETCWLIAGAVSACGQLDKVAVASAPEPAPAGPPTAPAGPSKPKAPAKVSVTDRVCAGSTYSVTLGWLDQADNEDGYHIYRGKSLVATLGPDADGYSEDPPVGGPYTYRVEAFNAAGAASATTQDAGCIF
jgi:hypothetical protein